MTEALKAGKAAFVKGFLEALPDGFDKSQESNNAIFAGAIFEGLAAFAKVSGGDDITIQYPDARQPVV